MTLRLKRIWFKPDGVFGELTSVTDKHYFYTLEHSYNNVPKIPNGTYTCKRGPHRLQGMTEDFETFEVMNVPKCTGILFHWGNYNSDSSGCVLLGQEMVKPAGRYMLTNSRATFKQFMLLLSGVNEFTLIVEDGVSCTLSAS
jgi:hypothetical protein